MTDTFDWAGLWSEATDIRYDHGDPAAAAYLRTRIEAAFVPRAEYDKLGMGTVASLSDMGTQLGQAQARAKAAEARNRRTLTDTQRLIWRDDVEGICPSPDMCFEYGGHVRCGPCAIKQSLAQGVEPDMSLPNLPEVSRLRREIEALTAQLAEARESERAAKRGEFICTKCYLRQDADFTPGDF